MPRFTEVTFVTASVPATSSLNHNEVLGDSTFDILKLKVVPSIIGTTSEVQIFERDTFLTADLIYGTNPFTATHFDPVQKDSADVETEAERGFITPYEDQDVSGELHIKLINNDSQAKTFTITIVYETVPSTSVVNFDDLGDVTITAIAANELAQWNGSVWINQTFAEMGLLTSSHVHDASDITTGELLIARGGTGQATAVAAMDALSPLTTLGDVIYRDASNNVRLAGNITTTKQFLSQTGDGAISAAPAWTALVSGDLPSHVHSAADITTGTLAVARGGTGQVTALLAFNALSPSTTLGDIMYHDGTDDVRLAGNITSTNNFLIQTGTGAVSSAPAWGAIVAGDLPTHTHSAADITAGVLAVARGGTELGTTPTNGQLLIGDGANYTLAVLVGDTDEIEITNGAGSINVGLPVDVRITTSLAVGGAPETSAGIELGGTTKAVLISRLNTSQRDALTAVDGMIVYNSTDSQMQGRIGAAWVNLGGGFVDTTGTPVNNQLAIFTDADTLEGVTNLTWTGSDFVIVGDVGIGGAPAASAGLELSSTTRAVLFSRMNTTQRDAMLGVDGMIIYNTSTSQMEGRVLGSWVDLGAGGSGFVDIGGTPSTDEIALWVDNNTIKGDANFTWDGTSFQVNTPGPHSIGTTTQNWERVRLGGNFTSGGGGPDKASLLSIDGALTGFSGDTNYLTHVIIQGSVTTQGATDTIAVVSTLRLEEPNITLGAGDSVTNSACLYVNAVSTIADNDYAIWVNAGGVRFDVSLIVGDSDITNTSVGIELDDVTRAVLLSRMTETERDALTALNGMIIYNSTANQLEGRANGTWGALSGAGSTGESEESTSVAFVLS